MISEKVIKIVSEKFAIKDVTEKSYEKLRYPKFIPMMKFAIKRYEVENFGNLFVMDTTAMGGMMTLSTVVLTPSKGLEVPFLLIDTMNMKKKNLAYVEFYDETSRGVSSEELSALKSKYSSVPDYAEKDGWYISERTPYSLIKGGEGVDNAVLEEMTLDAARRYIEVAATAKVSEENLIKLRAFRDDMCEKGNPSSATLEKLFGKEGAKKFFKEVIMPVD